MATFPSDDIWDKFDLATSCGVVNNDNIDFDIDAIMDETFADLEDFAKDFGISDAATAMDETFVKEEANTMFLKEEFQIKEEIFQINEDDNSCDFLNDLNLPSMDLSALEPDTIKSDCMWSSTLTHMAEAQQQQQQHNNKGRKRDISLTLSECNEGLMTIRDIELLGTTPPTFSGGFLGGASLNAYIETPLTTSASESDTESASTDEEIDVVSSDDPDYTRPILHQQHHHRSHTSFKKIPHIEPGRSLLLSRNRSPKQQQQQQQQVVQETPNANYCQQTFIDHAYFLVRPPSPKRAPGVGHIQGMLTPTESSDDDEAVNTQLQFCQLSSTVSSNIDKRKIAQAVQSLIKNKQNMSNSNGAANKRTATPDNIKFKFRMKFKSNSPQHSLLAVNNRHHIRRKSASQNSHCPIPSKSNMSDESGNESGYHTQKMTSPSPSKTSGGLRNIKSSRTSSGSSSSGSSGSTRNSPSSQEQKCREIRDLHNSMERQRRVDLRKNFDQLKSVVPELADTEKASKLNILNKASDYCRLLGNLDVKLRKDVEKESARNAILRKKLAAIQNQFSNGVRLSSGRISLVHTRREF
jgi:hypothetical protein